MNPYIIAALIASGAIPAWYLTADHYQGVIARENVARQDLIIEQQEQNHNDLLAYANRINEAGAEHDKNTRTIRNLSRELDSLRVNFPTCPVPRAAEDGADSDGAGRVFSEAVDDEFARFQKATGRLIERCDELNNDAIRLNGLL